MERPICGRCERKRCRRGERYCYPCGRRVIDELVRAGLIDPEPDCHEHTDTDFDAGPIPLDEVE